MVLNVLRATSSKLTSAVQVPLSAFVMSVNICQGIAPAGIDIRKIIRGGN